MWLLEESANWPKQTTIPASIPEEENGICLITTVRPPNTMIPFDRYYVKEGDWLDF